MLEELENLYKDANEVGWEAILANHSLEEISSYIDGIDIEAAHKRQDELYRIIMRKYVPADILTAISTLIKEDHEEGVCRWYA